eukprot:TRINITY_DN7572_c0_g2_i1.p1 TRINITY_DN7572_c0_g2~~TRINITY_DN7572_c0_g2_i1.p1  ORF type:complete len:431 (-),score=104.66 TRINITY_DN7572_c0_g2_i1:104-1396(-)
MEDCASTSNKKPRVRDSFEEYLRQLKDWLRTHNGVFPKTTQASGERATWLELHLRYWICHQQRKFKQDKLSQEHLQQLLPVIGEKRLARWEATKPLPKLPEVWADDDVAQDGRLHSRWQYAVETALMRVTYPTQQRNNITPDNGRDRKLLPQGLSLGLTADRRGTVGVSAYTELRTGLLKLVTDLIKRFEPGHTYTTIQINRSYQSMLHVDGNNLGDSVMICFGAYSGGELWVHRTGRLDAKGRFVRFDGNVPHATCPFKGTRWSIIYFTHSRYMDGQDSFKRLREHGLNLPEPGLQQREYESKKVRLADAERDLPPGMRDCICRRGSETTIGDARAEEDEKQDEVQIIVSDAEEEDAGSNDDDDDDDENPEEAERVLVDEVCRMTGALADDVRHALEVTAGDANEAVNHLLDKPRRSVLMLAGDIINID